MTSDMVTRHSSMERSIDRRHCRYNNKFSIESICSLGDIRDANECSTVFGSDLGDVHGCSDHQKILLENIFQEKSCKQVA